MIDPTAHFYGIFSHGNNVRIDAYAHFTADVYLGGYVHIADRVSIKGGSGKFIAEGLNNIMTGAIIHCASDRFDDSGLFGAMIPIELRGRLINKPVIMELMSNIGSGAIVMPGSRLRRGVLLTAGSLLMGDTEEWGIYKGSPAVLVKKIDGRNAMRNAKILGYEL